MKRLVMISLLSMLLNLLLTPRAAQGHSSTAGGQAQQTTEKQFPLSSGKKLEFNLSTGGSVDVTAWDQESVAITATVGGKDRDDCKISFDANGSGIRISSRYTGSSNNRASDVSIVVKAPRRTDVSIKTQGGGITINGIEGKVSGETAGGSLSLTGLKGEVHLKTQGGGITVKDSNVKGKVETMGGDVLMQNVTGGIKGYTSGGRVIQSLSAPDSGAGRQRADGRALRIDSDGGVINVDDAPAGAKLSTLGGHINVRSARRYVDAETNGGNITIGRLDGWVHAETMAGNVTVNVTGDGDETDRHIDISSLHGDIRLTLPADFSMDVRIELAQTQNRKTDYGIISDFQIERAGPGEWVYNQGTPRQYLRATGVVAGGRNKVVISTINGNVYLKKS